MKKIAMFLALIVLISSLLIFTVSASSLPTENPTDNNTLWENIQTWCSNNNVFSYQTIVISKNIASGYYDLKCFNWYDTNKMFSGEWNFHQGKKASFDNNGNFYLDDLDGTFSFDAIPYSTEEYIYWANENLFTGTTDNKTVFFSVPTKNNLSNQLQNLPPSQQLKTLPLQAFGTLLPLVIGCTVFFLAFRKGYSFLLQRLNQA